MRKKKAKILRRWTDKIADAMKNCIVLFEEGGEK